MAADITQGRESMLIQCHSCNTKYRLNLDNIPKRKTFVRCRNCGTPIYIDPTEEEAPEGSVIHPQSSLGAGNVQTGAPASSGAAAGMSAQGSGVQVVCPECDAKYRVEGASLRRPGIQLKCTQCGNQFPPPAFAAATAAEQTGLGVSVASTAAEEAPEFYPPPSDDTENDHAAPDMPIPDDGKVEVMFDDLRPNHGALAASPIEAGADATIPRETELGSLDGDDFETDPPVPDSEQAYLDSVSFGADDDIESLPSEGTVPNDQKYKFFLNPNDPPEGTKDRAAPPAGSSPLQETYSGENTASLEQAAANPGALDSDSLEHGAELPELPSLEVSTQDDTKSRIFQGREPVSAAPPKKMTETRVLMLLSAAILGVLVGAGIWGWWLTTETRGRDPFRVQMGQSHQLALQKNQKGHYVKNILSGQQLFVINGKIENRFDNNNKVRWIRIKGMVFKKNDNAKPVALAYAYAGNLLKDDQLAKWSIEDIRGFYGFNNGRDNSNFEIPSGAKISYQLVFSGIGPDIGRTVTEVISYHRGGEAVFIQSP